MRWSWRIGRIAGIDVYMHATFLILLGWVALEEYWAGEGLAGALTGVLFVLTVFGIIVLHELGHALTARHFGIATRDITLLPIGGVARLERMPDDPRQELLVALAGPAVNVVLAAILFAVLQLGRGLEHYRLVLTPNGSFLDQMLYVNVFLALFNLIPAFPMDGGRVLRALLALRMDHVRATQVAASVGQVLAFVFGLVGLLDRQPLWVFIALFVWLGAASEASMVQLRSALAGIPLAQAIVTDIRTLAPGDTLAKAVEHVLAGFQQDFPVVEGGQVVGVLTRADLLRALAQRGPEGHVAEVMQRDCPSADAQEMLDVALARLQQGACRSLPVTSRGHLIGLLTPDHLSEVLMVRQALRAARPPYAPPPPDGPGSEHVYAPHPR
jgi:Zn-dependent protease/predicted transcriptional regulator